MKEINQRSIAFGFLLEFRRVLHSCCSEVQKSISGREWRIILEMLSARFFPQVFQSHAPVLHASVKAMQQKSSVIESEGSTERRNFEVNRVEKKGLKDKSGNQSITHSLTLTSPSYISLDHRHNCK